MTSVQTLAHVLARHFPALPSTLRPGVTPPTLDAAEKKLGQHLPLVLRETYQAFEGQDGDLSGVLLGLRWLPFASDGGGNGLAVDLDPGPKARQGKSSPSARMNRAA